MEQPILKATHGSTDHPLRIGKIELQCFVLPDGRRVLVRGGVLKALGITEGGNTPYSQGDRLTRFVSQPSLIKYISPSILHLIENPIVFRTTKGRTAFGYEATILTDI